MISLFLVTLLLILLVLASLRPSWRELGLFAVMTAFFVAAGVVYGVAA
jgi:hypothetical protein